MKRFLLLPGLFAFIFFSCTNTGRSSDKKISVQNKGVNIVYNDTGAGDITLLFVHGWILNRGYWSAQEKYFSDKYRVVSIDLPGFGESGKNRNDWSTKEYGRDIDSVITELDLKKVILIGHSMAGDIVLEAAQHAPDRVIGIVGVDNFKNVGEVPTEESRKGFEEAIQALKHNFVVYASGYFEQALFNKTTDSSIRKRILNDLAHADSTIAVASMEDQSFDETKELASFNKPLYLINSDFGPTDTTGLVAHHFPYNLQYIPGTGHFPMVEKPAEFNAALEKVIEKIKENKK
jgi:pimeloyl-ACP methyl ester carboxylesterase